MFTDHYEGHIAAWMPAPPGVQSMLIESSPDKFYRPPYVGSSGWIGVELDRVGDEELSFHIHQAWRLVAPKKLFALVTLDAAPPRSLSAPSPSITEHITSNVEPVHAERKSK